uniref:Par3A n=1 Tax=Platynereis dumerilii TaxID=6359 RepID=A0A2H5BFA6_PLADU|nr:Par3A [Platynereis dumerilii]
MVLENIMDLPQENFKGNHNLLMKDSEGLPFSRKGQRKSLAPSSPSFYKWIEAQEIQEHKVRNDYSPSQDNFKENVSNNCQTSLREQNKAMVFQEENMQSVISRNGYIHPTNTRNIGEVIHIELLKGSEGLGFSVTTRDNMPGSEVPVYVKAILPRGPALRDGRLRSWDRILTVNGIEMTGKSQKEAVQVLREIPVNSYVHLEVSRQTKDNNDLDSEQTTEMAIKEVSLIEQHIPEEPRVSPHKEKVQVLVERKGRRLGIAVRGKTTESGNGHQDAGIYIRAICADGAAAQDGRVKVNDQLLEVNGQVLTGISNADALATMRTVLQRAGSSQRVALVLARRRKAPPPPGQAGSSPVGQPSQPLSHSALMNNALARSLESLLESESDYVNELAMDVDPMAAFAREGFGRKSMSEKRKGHLDPKISELYRKIRSSRNIVTTLKDQQLRRTVSMCALDKWQRPSEILFCTRL